MAVVVADDGEVAGHLHTAPGQRHQQAHGAAVVAGEDGRRQGRAGVPFGEQEAAGLDPGPLGVIAGDDALLDSEFNGRPERAAESEAAFWRSLEELLPLFEREGIAPNLEAHPDDFCEENTPAVDLVRAINEPWVNYLYCAPHSFHLSGSDPTADIAAMLRCAGGKLQHVHIADSFNHKGSSGCATSSTRPAPRPGSTGTWTSARARSAGRRSSAPSGAEVRRRGHGLRVRLGGTGPGILGVHAGTDHEGTGRGLIKEVCGASLVRVHPVRPSVACRSSPSFGSECDVCHVT